ncbi:TRIC cation channel family protein [Arsenicicoccus dermatophilus]|uniref:trimeric intracellular cation channel family protein n=1 Tax=Arsenicicoccus dermatophilus TaxID=1076331 RepID=UPI0038913DBE
MLASHPAVLLGLDLLGVFAFALSGGLVAVRKGLDVFGVQVLACVTALGGGVARDVVLDVRPVGLSDWRLVLTAVLAGFVAFGYAHGVQRFAKVVLTMDALGLATFMTAGTLKALELGAPALEAVLVGLMTAVGGGMMRDVLAGVVPEVLRTQLYAIPALAGGAMLAAAHTAGVHSVAVTLGCAAFVFGVRMAALRWRWQAPHPPRPSRSPS